MLSHKHRAIYFPVPKCASQAVSQLLMDVTGFTPLYIVESWYPLDQLLPCKYYRKVIRRTKEQYGRKIAIKTAFEYLKHINKPVLRIDAYDDDLPEEFKKGVYRRLERFIPSQLWTDYFKFTFARNPYDRMVSSWAYLNSKKRGTSQLSVDFPSFVEAVVSASVRSLKGGLTGEQYADIEWHTLSQAIHLTDVEGRINLDFIGRIENFHEDWKFVSEKLGVSFFVLERVNASSHKPYQDYYTDELQELVFNHYKKDFELLGYSRKLC